ncbi:helix-turn-helix domain-containing protein [Streptomyces xanthophaeus]|uniref:helix-turn-helix domain-containing protein n=1 Tax=Streptomyces xanthophaeus TaxID=67385 RepID=UPI003658EE7C
MPSALPRQLTRQCIRCGNDFLHTVRPGRPSTFCSQRCKSAARSRPAEPPDLSEHERDLTEAGEDVHLAAGDLLAAIHDAADSGTLMHQVTDLYRLLADVEAAVVNRGRARGDSWETIVSSTGHSADRLRKKWTQDKLRRRLDLLRAARRQRDMPARSAQADPPAGGWADGRGGAAEPDDGAARPPSQTPAQQLAAALAFLHRATGRALKDTAQEIGISASHVSRILAGHRRPSWHVVEHFAAACGGNVRELRDLWEAAQRPPDPDTPAREPAPGDPAEAKTKFHIALSALYLAADRPDLWTIQRMTSKKLTISEIARALNGGHILDWDATARIVFALRGRPAELRPLWQAATRPPTPPEPPEHRPRYPAAAFG